MSIRKKNIIRHYTIVEVMVAMGIFLVMMTIMMQFFTSAQKVWNLASKKNMLYADARVAMNLMTRELQSMLYDNDSDNTGYYPFWHECEALPANAATVGGKTRYYFWKDSSNNDIYEYDFRNHFSSNFYYYLTALSFIATTDIKQVEAVGSDVCEIRYKFIPIYFEGTPSLNNAKGGQLKRSCMEEYLDSTPPYPSNSKYNFRSYPYQDFSNPAGRVNSVFEDTVVGDFIIVISGVYSLKFTCYTSNENSGLMSILSPMDSSGKDPAGSFTGATYSYNLVTGTPKPVAIRIDMKLMDPNDLKRLAYYIYVAGTATGAEKKEAEKQIRVLKQAMRTFSKVIYLGKDE